MTIQSYGPTVLPVLPATANDVRITCKDGSTPTFTTPVTVDPVTHAVSFAVDDGGDPPVELVMRVQTGPGGSSTTLRLTLPPDVPPPPPTGGGGITVETDPVAGPAVTTERNRAEAAEAGKANSAALTSETTRAEGVEAGKAEAAALTSETSRATAAEQAASAAAATETTRAEGAESSETTRAEAAETAESSARTAHASSGTAHAAGAITVNPSGLAVVTTTNVQAALAQLDAQTNANKQAIRFTNDLIGNRPTPAAYGVGWYFASDDNGGRLYHSDGATWQQVTTGLNWASGTQLAYSELTTASPVVNSTAAADINAALTITVPASNVPVKIQGRILGQQVTGASAAVGSFNQLVVALTDAANTTIEFDVGPAIQASLASKTWYHTFNVETRLPAPFAGGTYKLRTYLTAALATGWSAALQATTPTWPKAFIEAVAE